MRAASVLLLAAMLPSLSLAKLTEEEEDRFHRDMTILTILTAFLLIFVCVCT